MKHCIRVKLNKLIRFIVSIVLCAVTVLSITVCEPVKTKADLATDTLAIMVGYMGMSTDEYVQVAKYHWAELYGALPLYDESTGLSTFSYFQSGTVPDRYNAIVDSARGFLISDILDYSRIYYGDIYNLMFYVEDHQGIRSSFDRDSLFCTRYYFENLSGHRRIIYGTKDVIHKVPKTTTREAQKTKEVPKTTTREVQKTEEVPQTREVEIPVYIEVQKIDEEGNPVTDENGEPIMESVPLTDENGEPVTETVIEEVLDENGNPVMETVPLTDENGNPVMETITEYLYDENGNQVMETVPETDENGNPVMETIIEEVLDEKGEPVYEVKTETVTDYTKIAGYDFSESWDYCIPVQPILAIEENWASFNQEFENIGPDYSNLGTSHRFRLLFGQTSPTETLTSKSDNYVSAVYVTLYGMPSYGEIEEGGEYGANTVELEVSDLYNQDLTDSLSEYLNINSTDESVIRIDRIETISSSVYSDVSKVIVYYSVVGDGIASFSVGVGANGEKKNYSNQANIVVENGTASFKNGPIEPEPEPESESKPESEPESKPESEPESKLESGSDSEPESSKEPEINSEDITPKAETPEKETSAGNQKADSQEVMPNISKDNKIIEPDIEKESEISGENDESVDSDLVLDDVEGILPDTMPDISEIEAAEYLNGAFLLSDEIRDLLAGSVSAVPEVKPQKEVTEVKIEDNTEEKQDLQKMILLLTSAGVVIICILGGLYEFLSFRYRLNKRFIYRKAEE